jgi:hypothetical protein
MDESDGGDEPAGFFIAGDIDGRTRVSTHNIAVSGSKSVMVWATAEPATSSSEWYFNIQFSDDTQPPFSKTCEGDNSYVDFRDREVTPERWFASRGRVCAVTFDVPTAAGTREGTFSATLRLVGTSTDYAVTNGHFRLPFAP